MIHYTTGRYKDRRGIGQEDKSARTPRQVSQGGIKWGQHFLLRKQYVYSAVLPRRWSSVCAAA
jgi:hypothetical protein